LDPRQTDILTKLGRVLEISPCRPGISSIRLEVDGKEAANPGLIYHSLCPQEIRVGDTVLLNSVGIDLGLGTGGCYFVIAKADSEQHLVHGSNAGHIVKLRYTPLQRRCLCAEEPESPHHAILKEAAVIDHMPVVAAGLHSQVAAIAAGAKASLGEAIRIAYVMNDTGALPLTFSNLMAELKDKALIDATITTGQAFGGDFETINLYTGLLCARLVAGCDLSIVAQGPGNVGSDTLLGFGAISQGETINAVGILQGRPFAAVRLSFCDARFRHQGISRQSQVVLGRIALTRATVVLPELEEAQLNHLQKQLKEEGIDKKHDVVVVSGEPGLKELSLREIAVTTMGRSVEADREFFLSAAAAGAAGAAAAQSLQPPSERR